MTYVLAMLRVSECYNDMLCRIILFHTRNPELGRCWVCAKSCCANVDFAALDGHIVRVLEGDG